MPRVKIIKTDRGNVTVKRHHVTGKPIPAKKGKRSGWTVDARTQRQVAGGSYRKYHVNPKTGKWY